MKYLVTDTHPFVWYVTDKSRKLPRKVKQAFDDAVEGNLAIWIPMIVLWEFSMLLKAKRFRIAVPLEELVVNEFYAKAIHLLEMQSQDIIRAYALNFTDDPFDTMIVAAAQRMECPLITADAIIHARKPCALFWD